MPETLRTERLTLRPLAQDDAPALHRFFSDAEANRYFQDSHETLAQTEAWVADAIAAPPTRSLEYVLTEDQDVIGRAAIWNAPELGYFLRRDRWGQGFMSEALAAFLPFAFSTLALPEIRADVDPLNTASLRVLQKLGFEETHRAERTICIGGVWGDSVYLSLAAPGQSASR